MGIKPHERPVAAIDPEELERIRRMTPDEKINMVLEMTQAMFEAWDADARLRYPQAGPREILYRRAVRNLGRELTIKVYGWDPEEHPRADESYLSRLLPPPSKS